MDATPYDVMTTVVNSACMSGVGTVLYILDQYQSIVSFCICPNVLQRDRQLDYVHPHKSPTRSMRSSSPGVCHPKHHH